MKLSTPNCTLSVLLIGLCFAMFARLSARAESSLNKSENENAVAVGAAGDVIAENKGLRDKLAVAEVTIATLQKNLASANSEGEVFRRKAMELNLRLEALGTGKIDDRLVKLLERLRVLDDERKNLKDGLLGLAEAVLRFQKVAVSSDADARQNLEAATRSASKALDVAPPDTLEAAAVPSTLTDGMVISYKEDLSLVVANVGTRQGVKVGMPFQILRGGNVIGTVRIVDVRDKIAGALIQDLSDKEKVKVGDQLKVAARP